MNRTADKEYNGGKIMYYSTSKELVFALLRRNDVEVKEMTYLEETIEISELEQVKHLICKWSFDNISNCKGEICVVGEEKNPGRYVTIVIKQKNVENYYESFMFEFLFDKIYTYEQMVSLLSKEKTFISHYTEFSANGIVLYDNQFETSSQIEIYEGEIKIGKQNPIVHIEKTEVDFVRYIGGIIPTKHYAVEECIEIYIKNGNKIKLYYTVYE